MFSFKCMHGTAHPLPVHSTAHSSPSPSPPLPLLSCRLTVYVDATNAWYDAKTTLEVVNLNLWSQLQEAVDIFGLTAVDRLFCFVIVRELQVGMGRRRGSVFW